MLFFVNFLAFWLPHPLLPFTLSSKHSKTKHLKTQINITFEALFGRQKEYHLKLLEDEGHSYEQVTRDQRNFVNWRILLIQSKVSDSLHWKLKRYDGCQWDDGSEWDDDKKWRYGVEYNNLVNWMIIVNDDIQQDDSREWDNGSEIDEVGRKWYSIEG